MNTGDMCQYIKHSNHQSCVHLTTTDSPKSTYERHIRQISTQSVSTVLLELWKKTTYGFTSKFRQYFQAL